jgi:hypothetical protein
VCDVPFYDLSNTANRLNQFLKNHRVEIETEEKRFLADRIATVLSARQSEARADDLSRMAWLSIHLGQESTAREYVQAGLKMEPGNYHLVKLAQRLGVSV